MCCDDSSRRWQFLQPFNDGRQEAEVTDNMADGLKEPIRLVRRQPLRVPQHDPIAKEIQNDDRRVVTDPAFNGPQVGFRDLCITKEGFRHPQQINQTGRIAQPRSKSMSSAIFSCNVVRPLSCWSRRCPRAATCPDRLVKAFS